MKFIAPISCFASPVAHPGEGGLLLWPDSCALPSGRPVFIPDFSKEFTIIPAFAVRITRLGKHVAPRFAHRYFTDFAPASLLFPASAPENLKKGILPPPDDYCFDSSIIVGKWLPADNSPELSAFISYISTDLSVEDNFSLSVNVIYEAISSASLRSTLKIGDIILIPFPRIRLAASENASLSISVIKDTTPALITKFK